MSITLNGTTGIAGVDGTASAPSVQGGDSNTGVFFPAADTVAITTGGSERMRVDSSGNVGIGTTTPLAKLSLKNTSNVASINLIPEQGSATGYLTTLGLNVSFNGTNWVTVGDGGNSGASAIGTTYGDAALQFFTIPTTASSGQTLTPAQFYATERFRIASAGQLGIGGANYGTSGQVLTSGGSGAAPSWTSAALGSTTVTNKTGSRATATTYQNTTNGWLLVCFSMSNNGVTFLVGSTSGLGITAMSSNFSGNVQTYLVPPQWFYRATGTVLSNWTEGQA